MQNILYAFKTKFNNEKKILKKIANDLKEIKNMLKKKIHMPLNKIERAYFFFQACADVFPHPGKITL